MRVGGPKIGALCYSSQTGLGIQTHAFYRYMKPDHVLLVDISKLNHMPVYPEKYNGGTSRVFRSFGFPQARIIEQFLKGLDLLFVCETPLNYNLFRRARSLGVKIVLQYNYELLDYLERRDLPLPDLFAAPTPWYFDDVPYPGRTILPVPILTEGIEPRYPAALKTFLHINGKPATGDRNGTWIFVEATRLLEDAAPGRFRYVLRTQDPNFGRELKTCAPWITVLAGDAPAGEMYSLGDALVIPRKYGGLCLPANEALAHGMPVLMPDISPNEHLLPKHWLFPAHMAGTVRTRTTLPYYEAQVEAVATAMLALADGDFQGECRYARATAECGNWDVMLPNYQQCFQDLLTGTLRRDYAWWT